MILLTEYNEKWPLEFENLRTKFMSAAPYLKDIHHFGSTAVPGLSAKPIIDMLAVTDDFQTFDPQPLQKCGLHFGGELYIPLRYHFSNNPAKTLHLHIFEKDDPQVARNLMFRDTLRKNKEMREAYAALKHKLSRNTITTSRFMDYTRHKETFIEDCLRQAGFDHPTMVRPLTDEAQHTVMGFLKQSFPSKDFPSIPKERKTIHCFTQNFFALNRLGYIKGAAYLEWPTFPKGSPKTWYAYDTDTAEEEKKYFEVRAQKWVDYITRFHPIDA